ncbi:translation initiation factor eIF-2B subunit gamma [Cimex lectularius]|uniref:Translation initiation factor eIF2B subunit gamma n=1 Tax=Cimex lectularius TaxID=79782 RepID=A0A8I6RV30_CIMLE|nr:translation initiation factor eIF-2B subunit gamma [Cimex lectularius]
MVTSAELQAVVLAAGKGSRMTELTARRPKCLLPIGNLPMIYFPLDLLERSGFKDAIVVVLETTKGEIQAALDKTGLKIKCDLVSIPAGEDWGTADSLRYLEESNKIKLDVLVITCDLITNVSLAPLLDMYRKQNSAITAMFVKTQNNTVLTTPGPKTKNKRERDFVGIYKETSRLVLLASSSDYEEILPLSTNLLRKYGKFTIHSKLLDAHVYIIRKWLCQYLTHNRTLGTLKGEVLPYVAKKRVPSNNDCTLNAAEEKASIIGASVKTELAQFAQESELAYKVREMSSYNSNTSQTGYGCDPIQCYACIYDSEETYAIRANTIHDYNLANRQIYEKWNELATCKELISVSSSANISSSQVGPTCLIGDKAVIAEKTSLNSTIVGVGSTVNTKTLIKDSVIMAGVTIEQGCVIDNCIICEQAFVGSNCTLKDCIVGSHHKVQSESKHSNEVLTVVDRLMEF